MKKKIFVIALAVCVFVLSIVGSSVAYFTDVEEATNVFTAGDVNITLTYADNVANADDNSAPVIDLTNEKVYPGQNFDIDATITNIGSEKAYVGAIITLTDDELAQFVTLSGDTDNYPVAVSQLLVGLATNGCTVKPVVSADNKTLTIYVVKTDALNNKDATDGKACTLFTDVLIPYTWDNAEMKAFSGLQLKVTAYATQTGGFENAEQALCTAFNAAWAGYGYTGTITNPTN